MTIWESMKKETNKTLTQNSALTFKSTESKVLDLFSMGGALRNREPEEIEKMLSQALAEDKLLAIKCLFYLRDVRGGQGERRTFREALKILTRHYPEEASKLVPLIPEYGRWDDLFYIDGLEIDSFLKVQIMKDCTSEMPSLLAKWMPSENAGNKSKLLARKLRKYLNLSSKTYRIMLTNIRHKLNLVETKMSNKAWFSIEYDKIPSKSSLNYRKAFVRNDAERYKSFLDSVEKGKAKINTATLFPYEIVRQARVENNQTLDILWKNLPDYTRGNEKGIVVADVSGSMQGLPMDISVSLAMYFAERNEGVFKNKFITFSGNPELQEVKGNNLNQKIFNLERSHWEMNTNLQAVFDLILSTAVANKVPQSELPSNIYIISDMEFDECAEDTTNFEAIKIKYEASEYEMPTLIFWNVNSVQNNVPATQDEKGVTLVSGTSPTIFKMVMAKATPYEFMTKILNSERYKLIEDTLNDE